MNKAPVRLGPLALLLTVISICLAILAILAFTTARADMRLAERYAATVQERYDLEKEGQKYLAALYAGREQAPDPDEDGVIRTDLSRGDYVLHISLIPGEDGAFRVLSWRQEKIWEHDEIIDDLWNGLI